jgi:hypothetical protein
MMGYGVITIRHACLVALIALIYVSIAFGLEIAASTGNVGNCASTGIKLESTIKDYASEHIKLNPEGPEISNAFSGTGSLPLGYISKSDSKGNSVIAYRSVSGKSGVTSWNYDWNTYTPYSSSAGYGVGVWLRFNVNRAYSFAGGSNAKNKESDFASSVAQGSSSGASESYLKNMYTCAYAFSNEVSSKLSADYGSAKKYLYFDSYSNNYEGEDVYHWIDAYGTSTETARIYYPSINALARKTYAGIYGYTSGAYGSSAIFRTHAENKGKMIGHEGVYYTGGGEFGVKTTNGMKLSGSVLGQSDTKNINLRSSTNIPKYKTAYLLDPFRNEQAIRNGYKDWGYESFNSLMNKGYAVTYYRDSAVSHSLVGDIDDYYISAIKGHMGSNSIELSRAAEPDRTITGSELNSMFTKSNGLTLLSGCDSFKPNANSALANAIKGKSWLSGGYDYSVDSKGNNLYMSKFFSYLTNGYTAKASSKYASNYVKSTLGVTVTPIWTQSARDFSLS